MPSIRSVVAGVVPEEEAFRSGFLTHQYHVRQHTIALLVGGGFVDLAMEGTAVERLAIGMYRRKFPCRRQTRG